jgi:hypothetical protein
MEPRRFKAFLAGLQAAVEPDFRVLALITVGSTADGTLRDHYSDHDVWLVAEAAAAATYLDDVGWLPTSPEIVATARFGGHYRTVVFDDGHLLTYAVLDLTALEEATLERYAVLFDRGGATALAEAARNRTLAARAQALASPDLLPNIAILCWSAYLRSKRGEHLSAASYVGAAVGRILDVLSAHGRLPRGPTTDALDPARRLELTAPALAAELIGALGTPATSSAPALLALLERELRPHAPQLPWSIVETVRRWCSGGQG